MTRSARHARRSPAHFVAAVVFTALAGAGVVACDGEDEAECAKDADCQEITCGDGSTLQKCEDGVCLQGTDCEDTGDGGW